jgi:hypothetical protein
MNTAQSARTIDDLKKEVRLLRSFVIGLAGKDKEGDYRSDFADKILRTAKEQPTRTFTNAKAFLSELKNFS